MNKKSKKTLGNVFEWFGITPNQFTEQDDEGFLPECGLTEPQIDTLRELVQGRPLSDIASEQGVSPWAVSQRASHGLRNLRDFTKVGFDLTIEGKRKPNSRIER